MSATNPVERFLRPAKPNTNARDSSEDTKSMNDPKPEDDRNAQIREGHDVHEMTAGSERIDAKSTIKRLQSAALSDLEAAEMIEQTLWQGTFSTKALYGEWCMLAVVLVIPVAVSAYFGWLGATWWIWGGLFALGFLYELLKSIYYKWSRMYRLTTQRFIHESGLVFRKTDRIEVIDIDDVTFVQNPFERMLGVGSITIHSSDRTTPTLTVRGIDQVSLVTNQMDAVRRKERLRRGVHITN